MIILHKETEEGKVLVDLGSPIAATKEQLKQLSHLFKEIKVDCSFRDVQEKVKKGFETGESIDWTDEHIILLFDTDLSEDAISARTKHSAFGVRMKRGAIMSRYMNWCREKGFDPNEKSNRLKFLGGE